MVFLIVLQKDERKVPSPAFRGKKSTAGGKLCDAGVGSRRGGERGEDAVDACGNASPCEFALMIASAIPPDLPPMTALPRSWPHAARDSR
jgi:hypothetical protein